MVVKVVALVGISLSFLGPVNAQIDGRVVAANVLAGCQKIPMNNQSFPADLNVGMCLGVVVSAGTYLSKLHSFYYEGRFPNLTYPIPQRLVEAYTSSVILFGPDVCFPVRVTVAELAAAVSRYGAAHPEKVTGEAFPFVVDALDAAFTCGPLRH